MATIKDLMAKNKREKERWKFKDYCMSISKRLNSYVSKTYALENPEYLSWPSLSSIRLLKKTGKIKHKWVGL